MILRSLRYLWAAPNTLIGLAFVPWVVLTNGRMQVVDGVLEVHGWFVRIVLRRCIPLSGGISAITFGHVVLGVSQRALIETRRHERVHVRQYERLGPAFIPMYLLASVWAASKGLGAYEGNYFERQASLADWQHGADEESALER
jgi:hypothetical protein